MLRAEKKRETARPVYCVKILHVKRSCMMNVHVANHDPLISYIHIMYKLLGLKNY